LEARGSDGTQAYLGAQSQDEIDDTVSGDAASTSPRIGCDDLSLVVRIRVTVTINISISIRVSNDLQHRTQRLLRVSVPSSSSNNRSLERHQLRIRWVASSTSIRPISSSLSSPSINAITISLSIKEHVVEYQQQPNLSIDNSNDVSEATHEHSIAIQGHNNNNSNVSIQLRCVVVLIGSIFTNETKANLDDDRDSVSSSG